MEYFSLAGISFVGRWFGSMYLWKMCKGRGKSGKRKVQCDETYEVGWVAGYFHNGEINR